jgi:hypothetical protein
MYLKIYIVVKHVFVELYSQDIYRERERDGLLKLIELLRQMESYKSAKPTFHNELIHRRSIRTERSNKISFAEFRLYLRQIGLKN